MSAVSSGWYSPKPVAARRLAGMPSSTSSLTTLIARWADSSQLPASPLPRGCLSAWPSTRRTQFTPARDFGGDLLERGGELPGSAPGPTADMSALPTGNSTSLWNTKRSPTTWTSGAVLQHLAQLAEELAAVALQLLDFGGERGVESAAEVGDLHVLVAPGGLGQREGGGDPLHLRAQLGDLLVEQQRLRSGRFAQLRRVGELGVVAAARLRGLLRLGARASVRPPADCAARSAFARTWRRGRLPGPRQFRLGRRELLVEAGDVAQPRFDRGAVGLQSCPVRTWPRRAGR